MRLSPGDTFDRYVIESLLGEGGMGEVYQARDSRLERRVALKVLRRDAVSDVEAWNRAVVRMLREARAAAALNHPNTVAIYDIGDVAGQPYLAMELIEGESLRKLIGTDLPITTKLGWLVDTARALSAAHRAGLVHRDVKPENVMLRSDGTIKVLDFGIARRVQFDSEEVASTQRGADLSQPGKAADRTSVVPGSSDTVTGEGVMVGTPAYMAPEQLRGEPVDARTDQFGWGVLAYEVLSGKVPFGAGLEGVRLLSAILSDEPPALEGIVSPAIERILKRTIAKRKTERFSSMDHVLEALMPHVAGDAVSGLHDVVLDQSEATAPGTEEKSDEPPPRRRITRPPSEPRVSPKLGSDTQESVPPTTFPQRATPTHTQRSPDLDKGARITPAPPTPGPIVRVETVGSGPKPANASTTLESPAIATGPRGSRSSRRWYRAAFFVGAIWMVAAAIWAYSVFGRRDNPRSAEILAPSPLLSSSTGSPAITDLPLPSSTNVDAIAAYKEGLQALRDASWERARSSFERATKLDPAFGSAFLRLAMIDRFRKDTASARQAFQRAMELQGTLLPRDQVLLAAFEPSIQRDPPDFQETRTRIDAAAAASPNDAELVYLRILIKSKSDPRENLLLAERCLELDSKYADCWQAKAFLLTRLEREQDALLALEQCVDVAPSALDCLVQRAEMYKYLGRCDRFQADVRQWLTKNQSSAQAYRELAVALYSVGESSVAVGAAVEQAARRFRDEGKPLEAALLRRRWALLTGAFDEAEKMSRSLETTIASEPFEESHATTALGLVGLYQELGDGQKASQVAERFLAERAAWTKPVHWSPWVDFSVVFHGARRTAGSLSEKEFELARVDWTKQWPNEDVDRAGIWVNGYAAVARTEHDAKQALAAQPVLRNPLYYSTGIAGTIDDAVGSVLFFSGDYAKAELPLTRVSRGCSALDDPMRHTIATYRLGVALEARGAKKEACAAYKQVLLRWGNEKRSVTAKNAATRVSHLKCSE